MEKMVQTKLIVGLCELRIEMGHTCGGMTRSREIDFCVKTIPIKYDKQCQIQLNVFLT